MTTPKPRFDATINLGHIFTMVTFMIAGAVAYSNVQVSIAELSVKIDQAGQNGADFKQEMRELRTRLRDLEMSRNK